MTSTEAKKPSAAEATEPAIPERKGSEPKSGKAPPEKWAQAFGLMPMLRQLDGTRQPRPSWEHACADTLHGWSVHAYHAAGPIQLSESNYLAAIDAVKRGTPLCKDGKAQYVPHKGALSPHCPHFKKGLPEPVKE